MAIDEHCLKQCEKIAHLETDVETLYRRVKTVEGTVEAIHELATSTAVLAEQVKNINIGIDSVNAHLESVDKKVEQIEIAPTKEYNSIKQRIVHAVVDFVIMAALGGIAWAIIQSVT